ncbi:MAG: glycoside hydrolase family 2 protein, partial [Firmicutes bacterium]|nr:glycoside hydrolase family 2 protein [Bacillota bacterium]
SNQSQYNLKLWISDQKQQIVFQKEKSIEIKDRLTSHFMVEMDHPHLWQGTEDPYQYTFNIQILDEKQVLDEEKIEMGLRSFRIDDTYLYLNEKPIRLHGVSRHQDLEGIGNALSDEMHDQDLELIEEIGANAIRLAHYQQADYFYLRCNQKGLIVWAEIPYITVPSKTDFSGDNAKSQLTELIMQNYNHTSILMWGVQNEITAVGKKYQVERIIHELHQLAKKLDPYRLTAQAQLANLEVDDSLNQITDVSGFNLYYGWYFGEVEGFEQWLNAYRMKNPKRPVCISEYGVEGIISYHSEHPKIKDYSEEYHASWHENAYRIFETKPYLWGSFVWNMFDFGSDGRDEGGIKGRNNKGLVTFDRMIKKDAFYFYKAKWSKTPVLHLTSKRFSERTEKTVSIKAYSNLKSISFYHQDQLIGTITSDDVVFEMKVHLHHGKNQIDVRSNQFYDSLTLFKVNHSHVRYKPPVADEKNVINWFNQVIKIHSS